jgi:hypothetical protein
MAYKICQFVANYSLVGFPANQTIAPAGPNSDLMLPVLENVSIKKIAVDAVYNQSGDVLVIDYALQFAFLDVSRQLIRSENISVINFTSGGANNRANVFTTIYKSNPIQNYFIKGAGLRFVIFNDRSNKIVLNNSGSPLSSNISFLISVYYV